jgi:YebC/PmpR family DNA-binding regulatory protein
MHRKGAQDAKRGKIFTKVAKEILMAAKAGGGDTATNMRLKTAIAKAKEVNLPKDKIETAIKKGTGEIQAEIIDEVSYEGDGPGGVAIFVEAATDNRNRTVADVRHAFTKGGGNMGESGSVAWMFKQTGVLFFPKEKFTEDQLMEIGLEHGAEEIIDDGDTWEVRCEPTNFNDLRDAFEAADMLPENSEVTMIAENTVPIDDVDKGKKLLKLIDKLEDSDDVQKVHANFDIPDELMEQILQ